MIYKISKLCSCFSVSLEREREIDAKGFYLVERQFANISYGITLHIEQPYKEIVREREME